MAEKYLREIEEILEKTDGDIVVKNGPRQATTPPKRRPFADAGSPFARLRASIAPGRIMLGGLGLLLAALLLLRVGPNLVGLAFWGGLVLFLIGYALFFIKTPTNSEKRWRGRVVEERVTIAAKLRRLFKR